MTAMPGGDEPESATEVPRTVVLAHWFYLAAAALSVVSLIVALATRPVLHDQVAQLIAKEHLHVTDAELNARLNIVTVEYVIFAIIWVAAFVLLARAMRRGAGWARTLLVIVTVLSFVNLISGYGAGAVQIAVALAATVMILLPSSTKYFAAVKRTRAAERVGDTPLGSARPGSARPGDTRPGDTRPGDTRPGDTRPGDARPSDSRPDGTRTDETK